MTRKRKNIPFTSNCASCGKPFETTISTKLYCSFECAKREENKRRNAREKADRADAKQAAE